MSLRASHAAHAATPGSYGVAPTANRLPAGTRLGAVHLQVADLTRSVSYYEQVIGLRSVPVADAADGSRQVVSLAAADGRVLVVLHERRGARPAGRGVLGLYHFAILLPDRASLGRFARHLMQTGVQAGAADHLVSEAFYLTDPDGLGIEVYADRPRDQWRRTGLELSLATNPLDVANLVATANRTSWSGMPAGTVMGHIHLHVGDLAAGSRFYHEVLGFDRMVWSYPGALFLGANGYHHHVGTNVWAGAGARPPVEDQAQLLEWTLELPTAGDVEALLLHARNAGRNAPLFLPERSVRVRDPWGTAVRISVAAASH